MMMIERAECVNCGADLSAEDSYCPVCGVPVLEKHKQRACPSCGAPAAQKATTCMMCGEPLDQAAGRGRLSSISWPWVAMVALFAAMIGLGFNWWRAQPQPEATGPASTPLPTATLLAILPAQATHTATPSPTITATPTIKPSPSPVKYAVQPGDTVLGIAEEYGIDAETLLKANNLDEEAARTLSVGQELLIPSDFPVIPDPSSGTEGQGLRVTHEVLGGDTLSSIAAQYDTDLDSIMTINNLSSVDLIYPGQEIIVPLKPPTPTPTPTLTPTLTPTPGPPFLAPDLLFPVDGQNFESNDVVITLNWTGVGILDDEQVYLVELETPAQHVLAYATRGTSWRLPPELWPTGPQNGFRWRVTVTQSEDLIVDQVLDVPPDWKPISPPSETRRFVWL